MKYCSKRLMRSSPLSGLDSLTDTNDFIRKISHRSKNTSTFRDITEIREKHGDPDAATHAHCFADQKGTLALFAKFVNKASDVFQRKLGFSSRVIAATLAP